MTGLSVTRNFHPQFRIHIPHAFGRPDEQVAILCPPEGIRQGHQIAPKELDLDHKWRPIWTKSCTHFGPKVVPILDQKLTPFWTQSCTKFEPKVDPILDQKCAQNLTEKPPHWGPQRAHFTMLRKMRLEPFLTQSSVYFGSKVVSILDPKLLPIWTKSCTHFGPKVAPLLD